MSQGLFLPLSWKCLQHPTAAFYVSPIWGIQDPMARCCGLGEPSSPAQLIKMWGAGLALFLVGASDSVEQEGKLPV